MTANSAIFSTTVYGDSSGQTANELATKAKQTKEQFLGTYPESNLRSTLPTVPSNQRIAKDK